MKCVICKLEIDPFDDECGFITLRDGRVFCEKCYANKRYLQLLREDKHHEWERTNIAIIRDIDRETDEKIRKKLYRTWLRKVPTPHESFFKDQKYVKEVKEKYWKVRKWIWYKVNKLDDVKKVIKVG